MNISDVAKLISLAVLGVLALGSGAVLSFVAISNAAVNPVLYVALGTVLGSCVTFFAKASGVADGAAIAQNAVNSITGPMQVAINATPPVAVGAAIAAVPPVVDLPQPVEVSTPRIG